MKRMILIDGNSLMYRAYYGIADVTTIRPNSKGIFTNAIMSFARMINTILKEDFDNILVAFDAGKHTFRHDIMTDYKAGRSQMPDEMRMQIAHIKNFLDLVGVKRYEIPLYEADDIIGTMAKKALDEGYHVDIYSSDKDLLQLIDDNATVHLTKKGLTDLEDFTKEHFKEVYNLDVSQFIDLKALMGDKSDNISGVPGIGTKKAEKYLIEYQSVEGIIANIDKLKGKDKENFENNKDLALKCKEMVTILKDAPIELTLDDTVKKDTDFTALKEFYEYLELPSLLKELNARMPKAEVYSQEYKVISSPVDIHEALLDNSSLIFEASEYNYHKAKLLYIGIKNKNGNFIIMPDLIYQSIDLQLFLSDTENKKAIYDYKRAYVLLKKMGFELNGIDFDMLLGSYILNPALTKNEFKIVASSYGYYNLSFDEEIYGKGVKRQIPEPSILMNHVISKVTCLYVLKNKIIDSLKENNQYDLLINIEIPLSKVLGKMEYEGIKISKEELNIQKKDLEERLTFIESEIYRLAGEKFNILSPKQLGVVLFEHLGLPSSKKTKTGYATDQQALLEVRHLHPVVEYILNYKLISKLYQTYIIGLSEQIFDDGKCHTIYEQALTQTGRLSSVEPNLQNIPIKTEQGRLIRKLFVPSNENNCFFSADYSQIELRVLAHLANVSKLQDAFNNDLDIHSQTAREIFGHDDITPDERRKAKAVNFGIIYGISAYGLATDIGISTSMASEYIKRYYQIYPEIKEYMDNIIEFCKENGYVYTIKNRKRFIPDINSKVYNLREFAKRTAMNAPIQGSAADIIKIAMINIDNKLTKNHFKSKMLLQIHDELLFEVEHGEEKALEELVRYEMEHAIDLNVKLSVSHDFGNNWYEVK